MSFLGLVCPERRSHAQLAKDDNLIVCCHLRPVAVLIGYNLSFSTKRFIGADNLLLLNCTIWDASGKTSDEEATTTLWLHADDS